ncbi:armadillo-type protein [Xylaria nigripes]|nr:armadillo-type protein [Xylaria nigripes]
MAGIADQLDNLPVDEGQRIDVLRLVAYTVQNLWNSEPEDLNLEYIAQKVGNVARIESNRLSLGESGLLDIVCTIVSTPGVSVGLIIQCLRIIGNSSADQDENRDRVVASGCLPSIIALLENHSILAFVIPVLFNIMVDYEPAQKAVYQAGINRQLISLITGPRPEEVDAVLNYIFRLLDFAAAQGKENSNPLQLIVTEEQPVDADTEHDADLVNPNTPSILLGIADSQSLPNDASTFLAQVTVALNYLSQDLFQKRFLETPGSITLILDTFYKACTNCDTPRAGPEEEAQLKQVHNAFTTILADLSANSSFASLCQIDGEEAKMMHRWILTSNDSLRSAACLILGNLARSDDKCIYLVQQLAIHIPLIAILSDPENADAGLSHSILSFFKNLAIPPQNRPILGNAGLFDTNVLPRIWNIDTQFQVQFDGVSLTRLLLVSCPENVRHMCAPIIEEAGSSENTRTNLHILMDVNKRSDQEPTVMETARAMTAVCRVLHTNGPSSQPSTSDQSQTALAPTDPFPLPPSQKIPTQPAKQADGALALPSLETFYEIHSTIIDAMFRLAQQSKFPTLRSELAFALALIARSTPGAAAIAQALHQTEKASSITELATSEEPTAHVADRENTLVLIAELLRRCPEKLPDDLRVTFEKLLREGGERLLRDRDEGGVS